MSTEASITIAASASVSLISNIAYSLVSGNNTFSATPETTALTSSSTGVAASTSVSRIGIILSMSVGASSRASILGRTVATLLVPLLFSQSASASATVATATSVAVSSSMSIYEGFTSTMTTSTSVTSIAIGSAEASIASSSEAILGLLARIGVLTSGLVGTVLGAGTSIAALARPSLAVTALLSSLAETQIRTGWTVLALAIPDYEIRLRVINLCIAIRALLRIVALLGDVDRLERYINMLTQCLLVDLVLSRG